MDSFKMTSADDAALQAFELVYSNANLLTLKPNGELKKYDLKRGLYFWVMRLNGERYKIYAGRSNNLRFRMQNYTTKFQPGVVNDSKMLVLQAWTAINYPGAEFDVYFRVLDDTITQPDLAKLETTLIRATRPFMNVRGKGDAEALRKAHEAYLFQSFHSRLTA
jgi:hypothetical protein